MECFKYVAWEVIQGTCLPMMEDKDGELFCTNKCIEDGLGLTPDNVRKIYQVNKDEFSALSVTNPHAKDFLKTHKNEFGVKRVRSDMRLWNEDDMLTFAFKANTDKGIEFRRNLRKFIKENAKRHYVSKEQFDDLKNKFNDLTKIVLYSLPAVETTASLAGKALRAQKQTKQLREFMN
jgi:hypothetical protein